MDNKSFSYEIVEKIAVLSQEGEISKELNLVSYKGAPAKYDLRSWRRNKDGEKLLKGVTLTKAEVKILTEALLKSRSES